MTTRRLCANVFTALPAILPGVTTLFIWVALAEAKTSAGAPWLICVASASDPAKLNVTVTLECACENALPMSVNAPWSEAAAKTFSFTGCGDAPVDGEPQP